MPNNHDAGLVSRETWAELEKFQSIVKKWNSRINLVSPREIADLHERHVMDSLSLTEFLPSRRVSYADLGSGGGFPGLVVAIARPDLVTTLVESDQRKAAFLRAVRRELNLDIEILGQRIEDIEPLGVDVISARALAPLSHLLPYVERHGGSNVRGMFLKGKNWADEVTDARSGWTFDFHPHQKADGGVLLNICNLRRVRDAN